MTFKAASGVCTGVLTGGSAPAVTWGRAHTASASARTPLWDSGWLSIPRKAGFWLFHLIQVEEDYPFEKTEINFWAETLIFVKYLYKHLFRLLCESSWCPLSPEMLRHFQRTASEQRHLLSQLLRVLPPTAEFLKTAEFTRLRIREERTLACLRLLAILEGEEGEDTLVLRALDSSAAANQLTLPRETAC